MELTRREALAVAERPSRALPRRRRSSAECLARLMARRSGRSFGSAVAWSPPGADRGSFANPAYAAILERECGAARARERAQMAVDPARARPTSIFAQIDAIADYARAHDFKLRGHTLFWTPTKWYPKWLAEMQFASAAQARSC